MRRCRVREGSVLVARPDRVLPPLTDDIVRETPERGRIVT